MTARDLGAIRTRLEKARLNQVSLHQATKPGLVTDWTIFAEQSADDVPGLVSDATALLVEVERLRAQAEDRRRRLVAAEADLLDVRGILSPNGHPRRVPMDLVPTVAPAVRWLADRVDELTALTRSAAPADITDRQLLAAVRRWAVANGWRPGWDGWANAAHLDDATVVVWWSGNEVTVRRRAEAGEWWSMSILSGDWERYRVASVRQAIDILCALEVLPPQFSSAYRAAGAARSTRVERAFRNELGRPISLHVERTPTGVGLRLVGPDSEAEWDVTEMEATELRDALDAVLATSPACRAARDGATR